MAACLSGLGRQDLDLAFEIILVDSASDPDVAAVAERFPDVKLVRSCTPLGAGAARNLGVSAAHAALLAFIDADCIPEPKWLSTAHAALTAGNRIVGGPVLDVLPLHPIAVSDNLLQFYDLSASRREGAAEYFPACNLAMQRSVFETLEGFPDVQTGEDVLFTSAAAERWSGALRFVPGMRVRHRGRTRFVDYYRHHYSFGWSRRRYGLLLRANHPRWSGSILWIGPLVIRRLGYIMLRTARWNLLGLVRVVALSPLLIVGLVAWAAGFTKAGREAPGPLR